MQFLHTMLRVGDMQRSIDFYTKLIGMDLLRTTERPDQGYTPHCPRLARATSFRPSPQR